MRKHRKNFRSAGHSAPLLLAALLIFYKGQFCTEGQFVPEDASEDTGVAARIMNHGGMVLPFFPKIRHRSVMQ